MMADVVVVVDGVPFVVPRGFMAVAMAQLVPWCRQNGIAVPAEVGRLHETLADVGGHRRTDPAGSRATGDAGLVDMGPAAVTYAAAARRLGMSTRTIGRWVADGRLRTVGRRVVAADLDALVAERRAS